MIVETGRRYRSQIGQIEIIVVRVPNEGANLACGGLPMIPIDQTPPTAAAPAAGLDDVTPVGKRYVDDTGTLELLVTKGGVGTLAVDGIALTVKSAKPLPSSDYPPRRTVVDDVYIILLDGIVNAMETRG